MRRRVRSSGWAVLLSLCCVATASAQPRVLSVEIPLAGLDPVPERQPCSPVPDAEGRVTAVYLDLETLPGGRQLSSTPTRRQQWLCPEIGIDVFSPQPSALTLVLEGRTGAIWEVGLLRLDEAALETGGFVSAGAGFYVNRLEWGEDGELAMLDVDFELDLADGAALLGRVLWDAAWTPEEAPFVPLTDEEWQSAAPGDVSVAGPDLARLFRAFRMDGTSFQTNANSAVTNEQVDSIRYSREPARSPEAAQAEVADDVAQLSGSPPPASASAPAPATGRSQQQAGASPPAAPPRFVAPFPRRATPLPAVAPPGTFPERTPARTGDHEPQELDGRDRAARDDEPHGDSTAAWPQAEPCAGPGQRGGLPGECPTELAAGNDAPAVREPHRARAEPHATPPAEARPLVPVAKAPLQTASPVAAATAGGTVGLASGDRGRAAAGAPGQPAVPPVSLERRVEAYWVQLQELAARWLDALQAYLREARS